MPTKNQRGGEKEETERRELGRRYRITAGVRFRWQTAAGVWRDGKGISRDISGFGISVISSCIPVPGADVEVTVHLPVPWTRTAFLRGSGVVLRLQPESGHPWGFAASVLFEEELHDASEEEGRRGSKSFAHAG